MVAVVSEPEANEGNVVVRPDLDARLSRRAGVVAQEPREFDEGAFGKRMRRNEVPLRRRPHRVAKKVGELDRAAQQHRLSRGEVVVDTRLDEASCVVDLVLVHAECAAVAPAVVVAFRLAARVEVAVWELRRRDERGPAVDPRRERIVRFYGEIVRRAT